MDVLLKNDLTAHYGEPVCVKNIRQDTQLSYFEIEDVGRIVTISAVAGSGSAKYSNPDKIEVAVIDYDGFLTSLSLPFQKGKERCDLIVYTVNNSHFLLNELKDRIPKTKVLTKAASQMLSTLNLITPVPTITTFIKSFTVKRCCYCNKQAPAPSPAISATTAFNRVNLVAPNGFQLSHPQIEALGFELFEYTGAQTINLN